MAANESILLALCDQEVARFQAHIWDRGPNDCWPWIDSVTHGYGAVTIQKKSFRAHRVVYILGHGTLIPSYLDVAHSCHYRRCCNPAHLSLQPHLVNRGAPVTHGHHPKTHGFVYVDIVPVIPDEDLIRLRRRLLEANFWAYVDKRGPAECWLWLGPRKKGPSGDYGRIEFKIKSLGFRKSYLAHRLSYEISVGPIPTGQEARHTCDVTLCVNHGHLEPGTHQQNMDDMRERGRARGARGAAHYKVKLTAANVHVIRVRLAAGDSTYAIGRDFGVHAQTIWCIKSGKSWAHLKSRVEQAHDDTAAGIQVRA